MYINKITREVISDDDYYYLPDFDRMDYVKVKDSGNMFLSAAVGAVADSALLGGLIGGDIIGGILGDSIDGDIFD